jgi:hypothetical protein
LPTVAGCWVGLARTEADSARPDRSSGAAALKRKLKEFERVVMRADKADHSFSAMIYLTAAVINRDGSPPHR